MYDDQFDNESPRDKEGRAEEHPYEQYERLSPRRGRPGRVVESSAPRRLDDEETASVSSIYTHLEHLHMEARRFDNLASLFEKRLRSVSRPIEAEDSPGPEDRLPTGSHLAEEMGTLLAYLKDTARRFDTILYHVDL